MLCNPALKSEKSDTLSFLCLPSKELVLTYLLIPIHFSNIYFLIYSNTKKHYRIIRKVHEYWYKEVKFIFSEL